MLRVLITTALAFGIASGAAAEEKKAYPPVIKKVYMKGCSADEEGMMKYCECTFNNLQNNMPFEEFLEVSEKSEDAMLSNPVFEKAIMDCLDLVEQ